MKKDINALIDKIHIVADEAALERFFELIKPETLTHPVRIAFVNAHAFNMCYENPAFLQNLLNCDYVLRDGAGMKILYKLLGREPGLNLNGTDLIPSILTLYKDRDVALMGTTSPYLERAAEKIAVIGARPLIIMDGFQDNQKYVDTLAAQNVPLVILAMGMPKQEQIARLIANAHSVPRLILCGGAILDFLGEKVARAPDIYRRYGLEWVYRLTQEPRRLFKRYVIGNFVFLYRALCIAKETPVSTNSDKLKVLHVVRQYTPAIGGLESYVASMVRHQKDLGYDCEVLTLDKIFHGHDGDLPAMQIIEGVNVKRVKFFGRRRFFIPLISPFYFRTFDIVHVHNTDVFYDYVALVAAFSKTPCFATTHGGFFHTKDFSFFKTIYFNTITRFSSLFYKAIFAISQNDFDTFKGLNKNIILQHNAIEPLGKDIYDGKNFLYIGRLARHKNVMQLIETFAILKAKHDIEGNLHIIGPSWDVTIEDLAAIAEKAGVGSFVKFHGAATSAQMRDIAKTCGYFVSASSFEGFGMSMLEGMSVGLIPLVHNNESFKELVGQSGVGICTDFTDQKAAASDMARTITSATLEQRQKAQSFAAQFSWPTLVQNTARVYRDSR